jgi:hypothetical protein
MKDGERGAQLNVLLSKSELDALKRLAKKEDLTVSQLVRKWIRSAASK